ncbi:MAG: cytochrome c biogenesis protein CcdA [Candidatus Omnitrophota bacterium]
MDTNQISIPVAFLAGVLSFLSPCVLPLVPGYISFLSGVSIEQLRQGGQRRRALTKAGLTSIFFVFGFSLVFVSLGASTSLIGKLLTKHIDILTKVAGVVIVALGLHLTGVLKFNWLNYEKRLRVKPRTPGLFSAFLIGLAFAFGWTPCVGPILAGILTMAAAQKTLLKGMFLLFMYSLGLGIPFIITGFSVGAFMRFFEKYKKLIRWTEVVAGVFLIVVGALIFTDNLSALSRFTPEVFYKFSK